MISKDTMITLLSKINHPSAIAVLLIILSCVLFLWNIIFRWRNRRVYRMVDQIPGPACWPLIGNAHLFIGDYSSIYQRIMELGHEYSGICRIWIGPKLVYGITNAEDAEILLSSPRAVDKDPLYKYMKIIAGEGLFTASVPIWRSHRRIIASTFSKTILESFVQTFGTEAQNLVKQVETFSGKGVFDLYHHVLNCATNIICVTILGTDEEFHIQTSNMPITRHMEEITQIMMARACNLLYQFDCIFKLTKKYRDFLKIRSLMKDFVDRIFERKKYGKELKEVEGSCGGVELYSDNYQDFAARRRMSILDLLIEKGTIPKEELHMEVATLLFAGSETTAATICNTLMMLGMYQDIQRTVYEEIVSVLGSDKMIDCDDLRKLRYTEMVIKESLRLFAPGPIIGRTVSEDIKLATCTIPKGASAVIGIQHIHRSSFYWTEPEKFNPDRFLPEASASRKSGAFIPFAVGPRNCVGQKFAMMAIKTVVAKLVKHYRIFSEYETVQEIRMNSNLVPLPTSGYKLRIQTRYE